MYRFPIAISVVGFVASFSFIATTLPTNTLWFILMGWQCVVYGTLIGYAWICRRHFAASVVLALAVMLAMGLGLLMIGTAQPSPGKSGAIILLMIYIAFAQLVVAFLGGYIGYALAQWSKVKCTGNSIWGKVAVVSLFAAPLIVASVSFLFVKQYLLP